VKFKNRSGCGHTEERGVLSEPPLFRSIFSDNRSIRFTGFFFQKTTKNHHWQGIFATA
jgi:hypothetical protein